MRYSETQFRCRFEEHRFGKESIASAYYTGLPAVSTVTYVPGKVVHFEIPADNLERAKAFYQKAFGWQINQYPGMEYHMIGTTPVDQKTQTPTEPGAINGGMTKRNNEVKNTVITVDVADIDSSLKSIEKLGGKIVQNKQPVADLGFTAYFKDTEGNTVGLWQSARRM